MGNSRLGFPEHFIESLLSTISVESTGFCRFLQLWTRTSRVSYSSGTLAIMATLANASVELQNELQCGICLGTYSNPKYVGACHHTFCLECLEAVIKSNKGKGNFPCPSCRRLYPIPASGAKGLQNDFRVVSLLRALRSSDSSQKGDGQNGSKTCRICRLFEATGYCEECGLGILLCDDCISKHSTTEATAKHSITPMQKLCENHREPLKLYCVTCSRRICHVCLLSEHSECDVKEGSAFLANMKEKFQSSLKECINFKDKLSNSFDTIRKVEESFLHFSIEKAHETAMKTRDLESKMVAIDRQIMDLQRQKQEVSKEIQNTKCADWSWVTQQIHELKNGMTGLATDLSRLDEKEREVDRQDLSTIKGEDTLIQANKDVAKLLDETKRTWQAVGDVQRTLGEVMGERAKGHTVTEVRFIPPQGQEGMVIDHRFRNVSTRHQCITAMEVYAAKSLEELRFEYYQRRK